MDVIYKVTYLPHLNTEYPKYYVGSKCNYKPKQNYMGSVSSKQIFEYTKGKTLKDWWKNQIKEQPENFSIEILHEINSTPKDILLLEREWQEKLGVLSNEYFNGSYAAKGWFAASNSEETKKLKSEKTKAYWDSPAGQEKKERLAEKNRQVKSKQLKEKWKNPTEAMLVAQQEFKTRPRLSGDAWREKHKNRKKRSVRSMMIEGVVFTDAKDAALIYGIHEVNVRRRCRLERYKDWYYI